VTRRTPGHTGTIAGKPARFSVLSFFDVPLEIECASRLTHRFVWLLHGCCMKRISIVMATYNGSRYLLPQLESLARQSMLPGELIISDDASTDDTYDLAIQFAKGAPFPTVVMRNPRRLGYIENFLCALTHSRFEYIAFCDQDDIWHPEKLAFCFAALTESNAVLCAHTANLIDTESRPIGLFTQGIAKDQIFSPLTLPPWGLFLGFTQVFDARLLSLIPPASRGIEYLDPNKPLSHDRWIYFLASCFGDVVTLSKPLTDYRQHQANLYGLRGDDLAHKVRKALNESAQNLLQHRDIARHRSNILLQVPDETKMRELRVQAESAHKYWNRISELYDLRAQLYETDDLGKRLNLFGRLVAMGAYRQYTAGGLGLQKFPKDIFLGLFKNAKNINTSTNL
jgi:glycosyltransferase involved in cell wall biosynthesis